MKTRVMLTGILLLTTFLSYGLDPPVKLWEKWYYTNHDGCHFRDMEMTDDGNLFITGSAWDWTQPILEYYCAFLLDLDGNIIWEVEQPWYVGKGNDGIVLPDSTFVITGRCVEAPDSTYSLFLMKISQEGSVEWTRIYDYPETREEGYGITCLPDGGFAVCGRVHGTSISYGQAWIMRTDAYGDTLWTREWGNTAPNSSDYGKAILYNNNEICVLAGGRSDSLPTNSSHLLFYDLDGNYLRGTDYGDILYYLFPADMCLATDGGYTFTTKTFPPLWHTDQYGETLWWKSIYVTPGDQHEAFCLRQTFDSGYIFSGWDGYSEWDEDIGCLPDEEGLLQRSSPGQDAVDYGEGWLVRFDSEGNELWNINNTVSADNHYYSCLQLPQGGYMVCGTWEGSSGFLVRYAPETGISSPDPASSLTLEVSPNPFVSVLSVSFSLPEEDQAALTVYDLYGRTVGEMVSGSYPGGTSTIEWTPPPDLGSGCYFVRLNTSEESVTRSCVLIR